jgi:hypothetical protein
MKIFIVALALVLTGCGGPLPECTQTVYEKGDTVIFLRTKEKVRVVQVWTWKSRDSRGLRCKGYSYDLHFPDGAELSAIDWKELDQ